MRYIGLLLACLSFQTACGQTASQRNSGERADAGEHPITRSKMDTSKYNELTAEEEYVILRSEEHTSELQSLMRISYAVFCLKKKTRITTKTKQVTKHDITIHYHY